MKLVNFASVDPVHRDRQVAGLRNASRQDRAIWEEFEQAPNKIAEESEVVFERLLTHVQPLRDEELNLPPGDTEKYVSRPMRLVQNFFRRAVLASYSHKCSICSLAVPNLLNASHIVPWRVSIELRADPRNGICMCVLHDRAFDCGLITLDSRYCVLVSRKLGDWAAVPLQNIAFHEVEGHKIDLPQRFMPSTEALHYHRSVVFRE